MRTIEGSCWIERKHTLIQNLIPSTVPHQKKKFFLMFFLWKAQGVYYLLIHSQMPARARAGPGSSQDAGSHLVGRGLTCYLLGHALLGRWTPKQSQDSSRGMGCEHPRQCYDCPTKWPSRCLPLILFFWPFCDSCQEGTWHNLKSVLIPVIHGVNDWQRNTGR